MADLSKFESEPRTQLLEELKDVRCVMLGNNFEPGRANGAT